MAKNIARDARANCLLEVLVKGSKTTDDAIMIAKSVCNSACKNCHMDVILIGEELFAAGNSGVKFNLNDIDLYIGDQILEKGKLNRYDSHKVRNYIKSKMKGKYLVDDIVQHINLNFRESKGKLGAVIFRKIC